MKKILFILLFSFPVVLFAQDKFHMGVSQGVLESLNGENLKALYSEISFGYRVSPKIRIDLSGGAGEWEKNEIYTGSVLCTAMDTSRDNLIFESSFGIGFQKRSREDGIKWMIPVKMRYGYHIFPDFGVGLETDVYASGKERSMIFTGIFIKFRF